MKNKAKEVEKILREFWRSESQNGAYHACAIATNANQKGLHREHLKMTVEEARDKIVEIFEKRKIEEERDETCGNYKDERRKEVGNGKVL